MRKSCRRILLHHFIKVGDARVWRSGWYFIGCGHTLFESGCQDFNQSVGAVGSHRGPVAPRNEGVDSNKSVDLPARQPYSIQRSQYMNHVQTRDPTCIADLHRRLQSRAGGVLDDSRKGAGKSHCTLCEQGKTRVLRDRREIGGLGAAVAAPLGFNAQLNGQILPWAKKHSIFDFTEEVDTKIVV